MFISFDVMRTFFHIFSILFLTNLNAQFTNLPNFDQKEFRFGYYLGLNNYDFKVDAEISDIQYQGSYYKILFIKEGMIITAFYYPNSNSNLNLELGSKHSLSWSANSITDLNE